MTQENRTKIATELLQIKNVAVLMASMFKPVAQHMRDAKCTEDVAVERIDKAYNFLKKYGVSYLETAEKHIKDILDEDSKDVSNILSIGNKL